MVESRFNQGQQRVYDLNNEGKNIFCSGVGGTGKTFLINKLKEEYGHETLFLSTTGISAVSIGGETLHSGMSIPIGHPTVKELKKVTSRVAKLFAKGKIKRIVLDEASMMTPGAFYAFTRRLYKFQKTTKLRNGSNIQILFFCDMGQLGAIMNQEERDLAISDYGTDKFYKMRQFEDLNFHFVELTEMMRQEDDELKRNLNLIRSGKGYYVPGKDKKGYDIDIWTLDNDVLNAIGYFNKNCYKYPLPKNSIVLATTNKSVAVYNQKVFKANENDCGTYTATISGNFRPKDASAEQVLDLKEGLKVIILKNDREHGQYVNGSTGIVSLMTEKGVYIQLDSNVDGNGIDAPEVFIESAIWERREYEMETNEDGEEELTQYTSGTFNQIPIKQCSALSVHRSQGQTLQNFIVDLGFGAGWATGLTYVALSRSTKLEDIHLKRKIRPDDVVSDRVALEWLDEKLKESREKELANSE